MFGDIQTWSPHVTFLIERYKIQKRFDPSGRSVSGQIRMQMEVSTCQVFRLLYGSATVVLGPAMGMQFLGVPLPSPTKAKQALGILDSLSRV
jgi:hypothetical protein